jgi:hypothetical protein
MCGEIEDWQEAHTVTIRLSSNTGKNFINLNDVFPQCEEIRLDEIFLRNFNGGAATTAYLNFEINGMSSCTASNEGQAGLLFAYDPLNPQQLYSRPKRLAKGMTNLQSFSVSVFLPGGATPAWTEAAFMLTVVCRRSASSIAEVRRMRQMMNADRVNNRDGAVANNFQN